LQARQPHSQPGTGTTSFGRWVGQGYIQSTNNGGTTNSQCLLRGRSLGAAGIQALPLVGFAALAIGLAVVGARVARRKH
jgi:hypothetical protein